MAKRRARKTPPASRGRETSVRGRETSVRGRETSVRGRETSVRGTGEPRQANGDRGDNLRRFTLSGWAVVAQTLKERREPATVLDLLGFFDWLGDSNLNAILSERPPLPCLTGCSFCCHVGPDRPDLLPAEVLRIVSFLQDGARATTLSGVMARLQTAPRPATTGGKELCFFLHEGRCAIYPVRPMRCRAQHSPDRDACERYALGQQETMPLIRQPALLYKSLEVGMRMGLHEAGLREARLAMDGALRVVLLEQPDGLDRWLDGEPILDSVAFPDPADEDQFLAQLRRQSRGQVRAEARRLHKIISSILEQPGKWALYSMTGQAPSDL